MVLGVQSRVERMRRPNVSKSVRLRKRHRHVSGGILGTGNKTLKGEVDLDNLGSHVAME